MPENARPDGDDRPHAHQNRRHPLTLLRPLGGRAALTALALACLGSQARAQAPIVGLHYEDLEPGRQETAIAFLDPEFPGWGSVSVQAADPCLRVGEPYNTQWDVWRVPATLVDPQGCVTSVLLTLSRGDETWEGAVLVALNPVTAAAPFTEGLELSVEDQLEPEPTTSGASSSPDRPARRLELTFRNETGAEVTVLAISPGPAFDEFFGPVYERFGGEEAETRDPLTLAPHLGWGRAIPPGGSATLGATVEGLARITAERSAWTLALLPLVEVDGERFYVPTVSFTAFEHGSAP